MVSASESRRGGLADDWTLRLTEGLPVIREVGTEVWD